MCEYSSFIKIKGTGSLTSKGFNKFLKLFPLLKQIFRLIPKIYRYHNNFGRNLLREIWVNSTIISQKSAALRIE